MADKDTETAILLTNRRDAFRSSLHRTRVWYPHGIIALLACIWAGSKSALASEVLGEASYSLVCTQQSCMARVSHSADAFLSSGQPLIVTSDGRAAPSSGFGDEIPVNSSSYSVTPTSMNAYGLVSNQWESIIPNMLNVVSNCVCPETANTCGETGVHYATRSNMKVVLYSQSSSNMGCSAPGDSIICHSVTSSAASKETVFTIGQDITKLGATATVSLNGGAPQTVDLEVDTGVPFGDGSLFISLYPSKVEPRFVNRVHSALGFYDPIMPTTYTPTGSLWWGVGSDGTVRVPSVMDLANVLNVEQNQKCQGPVESSIGAHIYGALQQSEAYKVELHSPFYKIDSYPGKVAVKIEMKREVPVTFTEVTSVSCVASPHSVILTTPEGSFGLAYLKPLGCETCTASAHKLKGKSTTITIPTSYTGVAVNLGSAVRSCTFHPQGRMLSERKLGIAPLESNGKPVSWGLPALSDSGPAPASAAEVKSMGAVLTAIIVLMCLMVLYTLWATRLQIIGAVRRIRSYIFSCKPKSEPIPLYGNRVVYNN